MWTQCFSLAPETCLIVMIHTPPHSCLLPRTNPPPTPRPVLSCHWPQALLLPASPVSAFARFLPSLPQKDSVFPFLTSPFPGDPASRQTVPEPRLLGTTWHPCDVLSTTACRLPTQPQRPISTSTFKKPLSLCFLVALWTSDMTSHFFLHTLDTVSWMVRTLSSTFSWLVLCSVWYFIALNFLIFASRVNYCASFYLRLILGAPHPWPLL